MMRHPEFHRHLHPDRSAFQKFIVIAISISQSGNELSFWVRDAEHAALAELSAAHGS